jgi:hypothetical protein
MASQCTTNKGEGYGGIVGVGGRRVGGHLTGSGCKANR